MSKTETMQRLEDLHNALAYCSERQSIGKIYVFTTLERVCINQERGSLMSMINEDNFPHEVRNYKIPPSIEAKVKISLEHIQATSWGGFNQKQFTNDKYY
ncbi:hypothetical protein GON26_01150 [Flavobacterium sp. GA093]|uniref:Uncharacterized protein n=1 Tax=Flavobacterium hydrocarbonoxydans TaxID=2683249 RepID=A0A6I4NEB8_9FLAO|nr:hypothetical protein [Flavobacterium hydrocarbonoxydans]MWB92956.1 hypothetical protein [Flavobacterium hydrocarbonoxydans]